MVVLFQRKGYTREYKLNVTGPANINHVSAKNRQFFHLRAIITFILPEQNLATTAGLNGFLSNLQKLNTTTTTEDILSKNIT